MEGSIQLPTRGYVFHFHLHAVLIWSSDGLPSGVLSDAARSFEHLVRREVRRIASARSRHFPPHRVREAEIEIQKLVAKAGPWRFGVEGTFVTCRPHVWLALDDRVKQHVRPHFEKLIEIECAHDVEMKRAQLADRLSGQWLAVLEKLVADPLAAGAAKLTEQAFAEVVTGIKEEQKAAQDKLNELLEKMTSSEAGPYERAESFDMLREYYQRNGGARPEPAART
jgi:hypothetical protein